MSDASRRRQYLLLGLLASVALLAIVVLWDVVATVFFTLTVAYVLYPLREWVDDRVDSAQVTAVLVSGAASLVVLGVVASLSFVLYRRRRAIFEIINSIPESVTVEFGEFSYVLATSVVLDAARGALTGLARAIATTLPVLAFKLLLFAILLYALLLRPDAAGRTVIELVPPEYRDVFVALNRRVRETLFGIYVLQAATAAGTFVVALVVFWGLGYESVFTLAVLAGVLQFLPVVGPGVLLAVLAVADVTAGNVTRAVLVLVVGGVFVGLAPDAVIRPRLATWAADLPMSLYFIGFTGGLLTVGAIGFIAGPLVVALLIEVVRLLGDASPHGTRQTTLGEDR